ncbi:hypothetical protein [Nocardia sp. NPDC059239]
MPRSIAATICGRSSAVAMIECTEPTSRARAMVWIASNSGFKEHRREK